MDISKWVLIAVVAVLALGIILHQPQEPQILAEYYSALDYELIVVVDTISTPTALSLFEAEYPDYEMVEYYVSDRGVTLIRAIKK